VWESEDLACWSPLWTNRGDVDFSSPLVASADPAIDGWGRLRVPLVADRPASFSGSRSAYTEPRAHPAALLSRLCAGSVLKRTPKLPVLDHFGVLEG
jgi:hypothetical protein